MKRSASLCLCMAAAAHAVSSGRVLCLQGKGGEGGSMRRRLGPLQELLGENWKLDCPDAPHEIGGGDRAWWINPPGERSYTAPSYEGDDESIALVEAAWASTEYDAILGFSQGAMLAAIVCARGILGQGSVVPKRFVLLGSALPKPYEDLLRECSAGKECGTVSSFSLHCLSAADVVNPPDMGKWVANCFPNSSIIWHDSGHVIPGDRGALDQETLVAISSFLKAGSSNLA